MNLFNAVIQHVNFYTSFLGVRWLHFENHFYFVGAGLDALSGYQTTQHSASCYPEGALVQVEFEIGFTHVGESLCEVKYVRSSFLACYYYAIHIREYVLAYLVL
jgi:hypothetical protein